MENLINQFETVQIMNEEENYQYYKFYCKCREEFKNFNEFKDHVKIKHNCKNLSIIDLIGGKNGQKKSIKFWWSFTCNNTLKNEKNCKNVFSSSLCNADLQITKNDIKLLKKYNLQCRKCKRNASFDNEELLDRYLKEKVQQFLIYEKYESNFYLYKCTKERKELEDHKQDLCEKCKSLGHYCGLRNDLKIINSHQNSSRNSHNSLVSFSGLNIRNSSNINPKTREIKFVKSSN